MSEQNNFKTDELIARIKELVKEGNIARIRVMRKGIAAGPWALITAAVATLGLDCRIILVKKDGSEMELLSRDVGRKAASVGSSILGKFSGNDKE